MKKLLLAVSVATVVLSSSAFAAPIPAVPITTTDCTLLGSAVTINLSQKVLGAYECDAAATTVTIATCHTAGSRAAKTLTCTNYAAPGAPADWNDPSCATGGKVDANGNATNTYDGIGYTGYKASSSGGAVGGVNLQGVCNANSIGAEL